MQLMVVSIHYETQTQFNLLVAHKKRLLQVIEQPDFRYRKDKPSLKDQLLSYLCAEIRILAIAKTKKIPKRISREDYRFKLSISSELLVYLFRLLIETEIAMVSNRKQLMEFISCHFETPKTRHTLLSADRPYIKYKSINQHTAMQMKRLLQRLIKQIDADFG